MKNLNERNEKLRLMSGVAIRMIFITIAFSGKAIAFYDLAVDRTSQIDRPLSSEIIDSKTELLIEPVLQDRYNLVGLLMSDGTGEFDFDCAQGFLPFKEQTVVGPHGDIEAYQYSYFLESSISASGRAKLQTWLLPPVEWVMADSGSLFYVVFNVTEPVTFTIKGWISARASSPMGYIESRAAVRLGINATDYILDHYIEVHSSEEKIPFCMKGILKPGEYYLSAWATGYFDLPGKSFSIDTSARSGYRVELDVVPIK